MKNITLFRKVIQKDCLITGRNINLNGQTCAIGALALAAGIPRKRLVDEFGEGGISSPYNETLADAIESKFGLGIRTLQRIQVLNDTKTSPELRRAAILKHIEKLRTKK